MAKLTARQEAFVREYLLDGNAAAAMRRTGYAGKSPKQAGWWHMQSKAVREAVDEGRKRLAEEAGRRALDVLHDIQDVSREAREGGDLRTALRGLELEGKHYGMFTDRVRQEISGPGGGPVPTEIVVSFVEPGGAEGPAGLGEGGSSAGLGDGGSSTGQAEENVPEAQGEGTAGAEDAGDAVGADGSRTEGASGENCAPAGRDRESWLPFRYGTTAGTANTSPCSFSLSSSQDADAGSPGKVFFMGENFFGSEVGTGSSSSVCSPQEGRA